MGSQRIKAERQTGSAEAHRLRLPVRVLRWRQMIGMAASRAAESLADTLGKGATCTGCCAL